jgi:hypothetical protein
MSVVISGTDNFILNADTLGTAVAGALDYNGTSLYFTPAGTQRGVVPGAQFFRLDSGLAGANVNTAQNVFGVGVTLSASTVYAFEAVIALSKSAGTTNHNIGQGFGGTATINNISYSLVEKFSAVSLTNIAYTGDTATLFISTAANTATTTGTASATVAYLAIVKGTVSINAGGTFIPQYTLSAAPGGAYTTAAGSHFMIYPIGAAGANVNVGTWA